MLAPRFSVGNKCAHYASESQRDGAQTMLLNSSEICSDADSLHSVLTKLFTHCVRFLHLFARSPSVTPNSHARNTWVGSVRVASRAGLRHAAKAITVIITSAET